MDTNIVTTRDHILALSIKTCDWPSAMSPKVLYFVYD